MIGTEGDCPHCGHPLPGAADAREPERDRPGGIPAGWLVLGFVLATALGAGLLGVGVYRVLQRVNPPGPHRPQPVTQADTAVRVDTTAPPASVSEEMPEDSAGTQPSDSATAQLSEVQVQPDLLNRGRIAAAIRRYYPPALRDAGVAGEVTVQFRINAAGGVDAGTIQVVHSSDPAFAEPAVRVVSETRWRPARKDGRPVAVWMTIPLLFATLN